MKCIVFAVYWYYLFLCPFFLPKGGGGVKTVIVCEKFQYQYMSIRKHVYSYGVFGRTDTLWLPPWTRMGRPSS